MVKYQSHKESGSGLTLFNMAQTGCIRLCKSSPSLPLHTLPRPPPELLAQPRTDLPHTRGRSCHCMRPLLPPPPLRLDSLLPLAACNDTPYSRSTDQTDRDKERQSSKSTQVMKQAQWSVSRRKDLKT